jgi:hypothetical protein
MRYCAYLYIGVTSSSGTGLNGAPGGGFQGYRGGAMQDFGYELPRTHIPRTPVNKARRRAEAARDVRPSDRGLLVLLLRRRR